MTVKAPHMDHEDLPLSELTEGQAFSLISTTRNPKLMNVAIDDGREFLFDALSKNLSLTAAAVEGIFKKGTLASKLETIKNNCFNRDLDIANAVCGQDDIDLIICFMNMTVEAHPDLAHEAEAILGMTNPYVHDVLWNILKAKDLLSDGGAGLSRGAESLFIVMAMVPLSLRMMPQAAAIAEKINSLYR